MKEKTVCVDFLLQLVDDETFESLILTNRLLLESEVYSRIGLRFAYTNLVKILDV